MKDGEANQEARKPGDAGKEGRDASLASGARELWAISRSRQGKFVSPGRRCNGREATARLSNEVAAGTAPQNANHASGTHTLFRMQRSAYRNAGVTFAIIVLIPRANAAWMIALHPFFEVSLGILIALAVVAVVAGTSIPIREIKR